MQITQSVAPDLSVALTNDNKLVIMVETPDGEHLAEVTDIDGSEIFRDRRHDRVTTVAACKELIRKAVELAVEVDFYALPERDATWPGDIESLNRVRRNVADSLEDARKDAAEARRVLIAREARHEGYGMTAEAIERMADKKDKAARKEWFR